MNGTTTSPDVTNATSTSLMDAKKTAVVAATAALITAQALQTQLSTTMSPNGQLIDGNNTLAQSVMFLPT